MLTDEELKSHSITQLDDSAFKNSIFKIVGIPTLFFIISILFTHFQFEYRGQISEDKSELIKLKLNVSEYLRLFIDMESSARGYVITKNPDFLGPYNAATKNKNKLRKTISKFTTKNLILHDEFEDLVFATNNWRSDFAQAAINKIDDNITISDDFRKKSKKSFDQIRKDFVTLNFEIDKLIKTLDDKIVQSNTGTYFLEILLICAFIIFIYFFLKKQLALVINSYKGIASQNKKQLNKLIEISKSKDLFLANMSHEIRTPLGAILGFVDLALEDRTLAIQTRGHLSFVRRNGSHLLSLVEDLFDLSKVNTNKVEISLESTDLLQILLDVKNNFSSIAYDNKQVIHFTINEQIPLNIMTDPLRLQQILINLLSNAVKFTKLNGIINLKISLIDEILIFDLYDNGIGIPENMKNQIFKTFLQVENDYSRKYGGAGLGLSISRKLSNLLDGDLVLVESKLGVGSHFRLSLPVKDTKNIYFDQSDFDNSTYSNPHESIENNEDTTVQKLKDLNILIAEDSRENQILFKIYLESEGANVEIVDSGAGAVRSGLKMNYDIILMDIQMPGIDGYEALKLLRESNYYGKIMALTAHAMKGEREKCINAGFDGYLSKPVNKINLVKCIIELTKSN